MKRLGIWAIAALGVVLSIGAGVGQAQSPTPVDNGGSLVGIGSAMPQPPPSAGGAAVIGMDELKKLVRAEIAEEEAAKKRQRRRPRPRRKRTATGSAPT